MGEINLLIHYPKSQRPIERRGKHKLAGSGWIEVDLKNKKNQDVYLEHLLLKKVREFGKEYFDGDRLYGYGGYSYNPRFWSATVKYFYDYYRLTPNSSILDVGCAKGFMLYDFKKLMPSLTVYGVDKSQYAQSQALEEVRPFIKIANATELPFPDNSFDLVVSINTVDHLPLEDCARALKEIQRVSKMHGFIVVNAWRTKKEHERLMKWNMTALTTMHVDEWKNFFEKVGYKGDYWWFIAE